MRGSGIKLPVEILFLFLSAALCRNGGRVCAILPDGAMRGESLAKYRSIVSDYAENISSVRLPGSTFRGVSGTSWAVVYQLKRNLGEVISDKGLKAVLRSDAPVVVHSKVHDENEERTLRIGDIAVVVRGNVPSPQGKLQAIHTTDFGKKGWRRPKKCWEQFTDAKYRCVVKGDVLVARVGRDCLSKIGPAGHLAGLPFSDCLIAIRFKNNALDKIVRLMVIDAIRKSLSTESNRLLRGIGASYVTKADLEALNLAPHLEKEFLLKNIHALCGNS